MCIRDRYLSERKFYPSELGLTVNDLLKQYFNEIVDIDFTAKIEEKLDGVAQNKTTWNKIIGEFYKPFAKKLEIAEKNIRKKNKPVPTEHKCPTCGAIMYLRQSRYGKFLSCSKWPKCKTKISSDESVQEKTDETCPECGKILLKRIGPHGPFLGCSGYPKCKFTKNVS